GWPVGVVGSWRTLAPGLLALVGPSVLATYTDARTWRAMLVVVLALAAVLVGTRKHLAAPFLLGVAVLPVEILVVFVSQLGTRISAGPWMLTLAAAGGLLLIIATYYERRIAAYDGAAAYVRDLR
ncbi:MAG: SCO7613 C-terminal domain-containing membrane protein, partial [Cellulosimicrobium funkei]